MEHRMEEFQIEIKIIEYMWIGLDYTTYFMT